jgi:hypothetical protein
VQFQGDFVFALNDGLRYAGVGQIKRDAAIHFELHRGRSVLHFAPVQSFRRANNKIQSFPRLFCVLLELVLALRTTKNK